MIQGRDDVVSGTDAAYVVARNVDLPAVDEVTASGGVEVGQAEALDSNTQVHHNYYRTAHTLDAQQDGVN